MPYGPNTSRVSRLPHGFFEKLYEKIHVAEDLLNRYDQGEEIEWSEVLFVLNQMTEDLKRQRASHLGNESL